MFVYRILCFCCCCRGFFVHHLKAEWKAERILEKEVEEIIFRTNQYHILHTHQFESANRLCVPFLIIWLKLNGFVNALYCCKHSHHRFVFVCVCTRDSMYCSPLFDSLSWKINTHRIKCARFHQGSAEFYGKKEAFLFCLCVCMHLCYVLLSCTHSLRMGYHLLFVKIKGYHHLNGSLYSIRRGRLSEVFSILFNLKDSTSFLLLLFVLFFSSFSKYDFINPSKWCCARSLFVLVHFVCAWV